MAILNIRSLPDDTHARLRVRAAMAGRSMEAEAREILRAACEDPNPARPASTLQDLVIDLYGAKRPEGVVDELIADRRREAANE